MDIGQFVRQERKRQGLTQQELADRSGVGLNFVYQLEKNKTTVQLNKTNQVLRTLGYEIGAVRRFDPWQIVTDPNEFNCSTHQVPRTESQESHLK